MVKENYKITDKNHSGFSPRLLSPSLNEITIILCLFAYINLISFASMNLLIKTTHGRQQLYAFYTTWFMSQ